MNVYCEINHQRIKMLDVPSQMIYTCPDDECNGIATYGMINRAKPRSYNSDDTLVKTLLALQDVRLYAVLSARGFVTV